MFSTVEPFQRLVNQGMILGQDKPEDVQEPRRCCKRRMRSSKNMEADALRLYEMFSWSTGIHQNRGAPAGLKVSIASWPGSGRLVMDEDQEGQWQLSSALESIDPQFQAAKRLRIPTIKKVSEDLESLSFNTAIAQMMILVNEFTGVERRAGRRPFRSFIDPLESFCPHILRKNSGRTWAVSLPDLRAWHANNPGRCGAMNFLRQDEVEIVIQINGKFARQDNGQKGFRKSGARATRAPPP